MDFHMAAVERDLPRRVGIAGHRGKNRLPNTALAPARETIVDRLMRSIRYASGEDHGVVRIPNRPKPHQAAFAAWSCTRQFQGRRSAIRLAGWSGKRASTSASQAC